MKKHIIRYTSFALAILGMVSCSEEVETPPATRMPNLRR